MLDIVFHVEHSFPFNENNVRIWLLNSANELGHSTGELNFILQNKDSHLELNKASLNHDYYTDILTFDYRDQPHDDLVADIFINTDIVQENALQYGCSPVEGLKRVMIHGVLHLSGFDDHTEEEQAAMREKENEFLSKT